MNTSMLLRAKYSLTAIVTTVVLAACADNSAVGPDHDSRLPLDAAMAAAPDLGSCDRLQAPEGMSLASHVYARGVQIYRFNGVAWAPVGPRADLFADAGGHGRVGTHYAGPYWESNSGSKVKGTVIDRCPVGGNAIDWLTLSGAPEGAGGIFRKVVFIQRVNTVGGVAPILDGSVGEIQEVPYTAEYYFYRAR